MSKSDPSLWKSVNCINPVIAGKAADIPLLGTSCPVDLSGHSALQDRSPQKQHLACISPQFESSCLRDVEQYQRNRAESWAVHECHGPVLVISRGGRQLCIPGCTCTQDKDMRLRLPKVLVSLLFAVTSLAGVCCLPSECFNLAFLQSLPGYGHQRFAVLWLHGCSPHGNSHNCHGAALHPGSSGWWGAAHSTWAQGTQNKTPLSTAWAANIQGVTWEQSWQALPGTVGFLLLSLSCVLLVAFNLWRVFCFLRSN